MVVLLERGGVYKRPPPRDKPLGLWRSYGEGPPPSLGSLYEGGVYLNNPPVMNNPCCGSLK